MLTKTLPRGCIYNRVAERAYFNEVSHGSRTDDAHEICKKEGEIDNLIPFVYRSQSF